jgi:N-acetylneuraminic acid mutarotase
MDETRIDRALREGPPYRSAFLQRPLPLGEERASSGSHLLAIVALTVVIVVVISGAALVGSHVVRPPFLPGPSGNPNPPASGAPGAAWVWSATGSMLDGRGLNTTTVLPDGMVLVAGGRATDVRDLASAELFDPDTGSWTATGTMTDVRVGHTATLLPDGSVLVAGGLGCDSDDPPSCVSKATAELYHPQTGTWTATGNMLEARSGHTATLLLDGTVLVAGGDVATNEHPFEALATAELYDPRTGRWTPTGSLLEVRNGHSATLLPNGTVLVAGCCNGRVGGPRRGSVEVYDPRTATWAATGDLTIGAAGTLTLLGDGTVLMAGGEGTGRAELYDPGTGTWTVTGDMGGGRYSHTATLLADGTVLVAGGAYGAGDSFYRDSVQRYDPTTGSWTAAAALLDPRKFHTAVLLHDGRVLVTGGSKDVGSDGWFWTASAEIFGPSGED